MPRKINNTTPINNSSALVVATLPPVTINAPDTRELVQEYTERVAPYLNFRISTDADFVLANQLFTQVTSYIDKVDRLFEEPCNLAFKTHRSITGIRGGFTKPADSVKAHLNAEIFRWREQKRREDEERQRQAQAAEAARVEAERKRLEEERLAQQQDLLPWEESEPLPPVEVLIPEPEMVRLPSSIPVVAGGPSVRNTPFKGRVIDPKAFYAWIAENPEERAVYAPVALPALNVKARELEKTLGDVIPGTEAYRDEILVG